MPRPPAAAAGSDRALLSALRCHKLGRLDRAEALYREVLAAEPDRADVHHLLGLALAGQGKTGAAIAAYRKALARDPRLHEAHHDLGRALWARGEAAEAVAHYRKAVALKPDFANAHVNLGVALAEEGGFADALDCYRRALGVRPDDAETLYRMARAWTSLGEDERAIRTYRHCLTQAPDHVEARFHLALTLLRRGDFTAGWEEYDWRLSRPEHAQRAARFPQPAWTGEALDGRTILVWGEQGVGEEIMFASMIPEVAARAGRCLVECDPRLVPLFARSFAGAEVFARRPEAPAPALDADVQSAAGSLARWLGPTGRSFAPARAYLRADDESVARQKARLAALGDGPRIGIAWRSRGANRRYSARKSSDLGAWAPVLRQPGVRFVNLQYGECAEDLASVKAELAVTVHQDPEVDQMRSLDDFAAQIAALDLVITTSNTTAHMAGALGRPVWVLLPSRADWRWQEGRADSLWYPNARLFRQRRAGDWDELLDRVGAVLAEYLSEPRR